MNYQWFVGIDVSKSTLDITVLEGSENKKYYQIGNAIKEASENSPIIISTHSENLLNSFEIENIRVFEKDEKNSSKIFSYTEKDFEGWYEDFSVGKMWRQGDLGGNRW